MTTMGCKRDQNARRIKLKRSILNRVSKSERRRQELREDTAWAHMVIDRAGNRCEKCGRIGTQGHHIVRRGNPTLRHHQLNGVALCPEHHAWAHSKPGEFREWLYLNRHERWIVLAERHRSDGPVTATEIRERICVLKHA